jgi:hypothetical protein
MHGQAFSRFVSLWMGVLASACVLEGGAESSARSGVDVDAGSVSSTEADLGGGHEKVLNDCSAAQREVITKDIRVARYALSALVRHGTNVNHPTWLSSTFVAPGLGSAAVSERIADRADVLSSWLGDDDLKVTCDRNACDEFTLAYVNTATVRKINFCNRYFTEPRRVRVSTLVHEASHGPLNAEDHYRECDLDLQVHNEAVRASAGISARENVAHYYLEDCDPNASYAVRHGASATCERSNRCVRPDNNADWWGSASIVALGFDIAGLHAMTRGREPTLIELEQELARIANGEDPRALLTCVSTRLQTTWAAPSARSEAFWNATVILREFALRADASNPCDAISGLFSAADAHGFMYAPLYEGIELPTPDGPIPFTRTGHVSDFLTYASSADDLSGAETHFRACSTAIALSTIVH